MSATCNCRTCQANKMIAAEVEKRGGKIEAGELLGLAVDLMAAVMHGMSKEERAVASMEVGMAVAIRIRQMDAADAGVTPTHQPEARVQ